MKPIIQVRNISKTYRLGGPARFRTLRDALAAKFSRRAGPSGSGEFWALRDVSFDVGEGEVIGIIGKNGAGKSTLLKILSRITEPTGGELILRGRVASLLEVGTGFHPELTGRENIFLNGIILGMKRAEVRARFDEIVGFSEVERFLDTPVKRYSSGMYVRLAFAVAAHLDPDILVVDEVLAVGDLAFQQKCLNKMGDLASQGGRTILFVSHSLDAIRKLTRRCIVMDHGRVSMDAPTREAVPAYIESMVGSGDSDQSLADKDRPHWAGDRKLTIERASVNSSPPGCLAFTIGINPSASVEGILAELKIHSPDGWTIGTAFPEVRCPVVAGRPFDLAVRVGNPGLAPGRYFCTLVILDPARRVRDAVCNVLPFTIDPPASLPHQHHAWDDQWGSLELPIDGAEIIPRGSG